MITKIKNYLKSYDALRESMRFDKLPNGDFAAIEIKIATKLDIAFDCLTEEEYVEASKIVEGMEELIEKENDIRGFLEKNNNPLKDSFYAFYNAYEILKNSNISQDKKQQKVFKNFLPSFMNKETK